MLKIYPLFAIAKAMFCQQQSAFYDLLVQGQCCRSLMLKKCVDRCLFLSDLSVRVAIKKRVSNAPHSFINADNKSHKALMSLPIFQL